MKINFDIVTVLLGMIIAQAFFAAVLLWFFPANRLANRFLSLLTAAMATWLVDSFFRVSGIYGQDPNYYFLPIFYSLGFGPLIYYYVRSLTNREFTFKAVYLLHFIPVVLQTSLYLFLRTQSYDFRNWYWHTVHKPYLYRLEFDGTWISLLIYLLLSIRLLQGYQQWVKEQFSEVSQLQLQWLKILLTLTALISLQWLVELVLRDVNNSYFQYDYSNWLLSGLVLLISIMGLRQANLYQAHYEGLTKQPVQHSAEIDTQLVDRISFALVHDRLYLNPTLTLAELARYLKAPVKSVSVAINAGLGQSFNQLINAHRVDQVKRRLSTADWDKLTLLAIALESGFNSKTTFNRIFKEHTGVSPRQWLLERTNPDLERPKTSFGATGPF